MTVTPEAAEEAGTAGTGTEARADARPRAELRRWIPILALAAVLNVPFLHLALRGAEPVSADVPFSDNFDRAELGPAWERPTGGGWRIVQGQLHAPGVKNNPLWLEARLPQDVLVEFEARALGNDGDIKFEIFGDGRHHASGYVCVLGGWKNTISTLARLDEHGKDRKERKDKRVEKGRAYTLRIERKGGRIAWFVDNEPFLSWDDPEPLAGEGHDRFGFSAWESDVLFDNLRIEPL